MSEHLEVLEACRHLVVIGNNPRRGAAPLNRPTGRPQALLLIHKDARSRNRFIWSHASHDCSGWRRRTRRNGRERVVGGNKPFIETLSGDQEHEEAIRHLLPLYECRLPPPPPLLIAVAPRRPDVLPDRIQIVEDHTRVCLEKIIL